MFATRNIGECIYWTSSLGNAELHSTLGFEWDRTLEDKMEQMESEMHTEVMHSTAKTLVIAR